MTCNWKHWCLNGCGKKAVYYRKNMKDYYYQCQVCGAKFTKEQIIKYRNGEYTKEELKEIIKELKIKITLLEDDIHD